MELVPEQFKRFLPLPLTVITTVDASGIPNAAPYSCVMPHFRSLGESVARREEIDP